MSEWPMNYELMMTLIRKHEGYRTHLYKCPEGKLTIGVGHNIEDNGLHPKVIEHQFREDIQDAIHICQKIFMSWPLIPQNKQAALVDMAFNLGEPRLREFKKMIAAIESKDYALASKEMLDSKWAGQVGQRAIELSNIMKEAE